MTRIRDKIGVCLQPDTRGPIAQPGKVAEAMRYLGLDTIRIRAPIVGADSWGRIYKPLGKAGMRILCTHKGGRDVAAEVRDLAEFERLFPGQVIGYEGPNEPDTHPVTFGGVTDIRRSEPGGPTLNAALALMRAQRDELRKVPALDDALVVAFNDFRLREQRPFSSIANAHIYPRGKTLSASASYIAGLIKAHGRGGIILTEWGYTTGTGKDFGEVTPERKAANLAKDIAYVIATPAIRLACIYTLVSSVGDGEQDNFGVFGPDWSPTPAAEAIRAATA